MTNVVEKVPLVKGHTPPLPGALRDCGRVSEHDWKSLCAVERQADSASRRSPFLWLIVCEISGLVVFFIAMFSMLDSGPGEDPSDTMMPYLIPVSFILFFMGPVGMACTRRQHGSTSSFAQLTAALSRMNASLQGTGLTVSRESDIDAVGAACYAIVIRSTHSTQAAGSSAQPAFQPYIPSSAPVANVQQYAAPPGPDANAVAIAQPV